MDFVFEKNRMLMQDENFNILGYAEFSNYDFEEVNITKVFVNEAFRGKGYASIIMEQLAKKLKLDNKKVSATCSYAQKWLNENFEV